MRITLTGSLGRIGKPLTKKLLNDGHIVTVISSTNERKEPINELGAIPAIGQLEDVPFLVSQFQDADAVYLMVPPANYFDHQLNLYEHFKEIGDAFYEALSQVEVSHIVNLSSIGAHLESGNGILEGTYYVEKVLNNLAGKASIVHIRPTEIYYNLFQYVYLIKNHGMMGSNLAEDNFNAWVSTEDIADAVVEELTDLSRRNTVRYVTSEELTYQEVAATLGTAVGKPDLQWIQFTDNDLLQNLVGVGMNPHIAGQMVEMYAAIRSSLLYEHYHTNKPAKFGAVKLRDFAKDFAAVYNNKSQ